MLPHRAVANVYVSYLNVKDADSVDSSMRDIIKTREFRSHLELISERPPLKKSKRNEAMYKRLKDVADQWEIPLNRESSLSPSVGGLVPSKVPAICGIGPIACNVDTPQEGVLRISLLQRALLLAQYLTSKARNNRK
jgi:D-alanine-D-alanine ligase